MASVSWKKNYPGLCRDLVYFIFFKNFFVCQDRNMKFSASVWFTISWNLFKWAEILWGFMQSKIKLSVFYLDLKKVVFQKNEVYQVSEIFFFQRADWCPNFSNPQLWDRAFALFFLRIIFTSTYAFWDCVWDGNCHKSMFGNWEFSVQQWYDTILADTSHWVNLRLINIIAPASKYCLPFP